MTKLINEDGLSELSSLVKEKVLITDKPKVQNNSTKFSGLDGDYERIYLNYDVTDMSNSSTVGSGTVAVKVFKLSKKLYIAAIQETVETTLTNTTGSSKYYHVRIYLSNLGWDSFLCYNSKLSTRADEFCHTGYSDFGGGPIFDSYGVVDNNITNAGIYLRYMVLGIKNDN